MPIFIIIQDPFANDDQNVAVIFPDDFVGSWNFSHKSWFSPPPTRFAIKIQKNSLLFHPPRDAERKIKTSGSQTKWFLQRIKWWLQVTTRILFRGCVNYCFELFRDCKFKSKHKNEVLFLRWGPRSEDLYSSSEERRVIFFLFFCASKLHGNFIVISSAFSS